VPPPADPPPNPGPPPPPSPPQGTPAPPLPPHALPSQSSSQDEIYASEGSGASSEVHMVVDITSSLELTELS